LKRNRTEQVKARKILIVDDNSEIRKKIKEILISRLPQIDVIETEKAETAAKIIDERLPDAIVADINVPVKGGLWLVERAKMRHPEMPIIINSLSDTREYQTAAFQLGADHFLSKKTNSLSAMVEIIRSLPDSEN